MAVALSRKLPLMPAEAPQPAKPAELRFHLLLLALAIALGVLLQLYGPAVLRSVFAQVRLDSPAGVLALLLALLASIIAHELGHLCAALSLNYEVLGATLGPLKLDIWNGRWRVRWLAGPWFRCSVSAVPREMPAAWRFRTLIVVTAGPAVSLFALCLSTALAANVPSAFWSSCAEVNFFLFVLGLLPNSRLAKIRNDAALFLALCKNDSDAADMRVCHQAIQLTLRRIRPADYPQPLLLELIDFGGSPHTRLMVARRMVEWAVDSGHIELAAEWQRSALAISQLCSAYWANIVLAESACFDVLFQEDVQAAARKFANVKFKALFPPCLAARALAARSLGAGLLEDVPRQILSGQYHLPLGNPYYEYERSLLAKLHSKALALAPPAIETEMLMF